MKTFFTYLAALGIKAGIYYIAIAHGLGIQPKSWLLFYAMVLGSAVLAECFNMAMNEDKKATA